jgi:hypothetical protein
VLSLSLEDLHSHAVANRGVARGGLLERVAVGQQDESENALGGHIQNHVGSNLGSGGEDVGVLSEVKHNGVGSPEHDSEEEELFVASRRGFSDGLGLDTEGDSQVVHDGNEEEASKDPHEQRGVSSGQASSQTSQDHQDIEDDKHDSIFSGDSSEGTKIQKKKGSGDQPVKVTGVVENTSINHGVTVSCDLINKRSKIVSC